MTAKELNNQTFEAIRTIRETAAECGLLLLGYRKRRSKIAGDAHTSDERKAELAATTRKEALDELAGIGSRVAAAKDRVTAALKAARLPSGTTEEQLLDEQRLSRAADRVQRDLDGGASATELAAAAAESDDVYTIRALLDDLPHRLRAAGAEKDVIAGELWLVKDRAGATLPEVVSKVDEVEHDLEQAAYFAQMSLAEVRGELEGRSEALYLPSSKTDGLNLMKLRR